MMYLYDVSIVLLIVLLLFVNFAPFASGAAGCPEGQTGSRPWLHGVCWQRALHIHLLHRAAKRWIQEDIHTPGAGRGHRKEK